MLNTIKKRADFLSITDKGKRFITGSFILQTRPRPADHPAQHVARFGFTVTKKMGNAVTRNRIKRRLREAVRLAGVSHALADNDYVVIPRHKAKDCTFADLLRDMEFAFSRIIYMKNDNQLPTKSKK